MSERTECSCEKCRVGCKTMPGNLVEGDMESIMGHLGVQPGDSVEFIENHFAASDGPLCMKDGVTFRVGSIVPQQRMGGSCVFLGEEGECRIHAVSPYGCRMFKTCEIVEGDSEKSKQSVAMMTGESYQGVWRYLIATNHKTKPLSARRDDFNREFEKCEE